MYINLSKYPDPNKTYSVNFPELNGGLNLRDADYLLKANESPYMLNMWWKDGMLQCRPGQEEIATTVDTGEPERSGATVAAYADTFYDHAFVHIGRVMYYFDPSVKPVIYHPMLTDLNPVRGTFFRYRDDLFYKNGAWEETIIAGGSSTTLQHHGGFYRIQYMPEDRLKFVMSRVEDEAYVPTTVLNADPATGSGDLYQPENRLTGRKRVVYKATTQTETKSFTGDGTNTAFARPHVAGSRAERYVGAVYVNGTLTPASDYTVSNEGEAWVTVTFKTPPADGAQITIQYTYRAAKYWLPSGGTAEFSGTIKVTATGSELAQVFNVWALVKDSEQLPAGAADYLTASTRLLKIFKNGALTEAYTSTYQQGASVVSGHTRSLTTSVVKLLKAPIASDTFELYVGVSSTYYSAHAEQVFVDGMEYFDQDTIKVAAVSGQTTYQLSRLASGLYPAVGKMVVAPALSTTPAFSYNRDTGVLTLASAIAAGHTLLLSPACQFSTVDSEYVQLRPAPKPESNASSTVEITYNCDNPDAYSAVMDCKYAFSGGGKDSLCILLGGCPSQPNAVFWNSNDSVSMNPAYFPMSYYNLVGDTEDAVTGFGRQYSDLIVFKERSIHKLEYDTQTLDGRELISFTAKPVNAKTGCDLPWTIQLIENNLVFCNTYTGAHILLSSSAAYENNVASLSLKVNEGRHELVGLLPFVRNSVDDAGSYVYSFDDDHRYWLVYEGTAFLWDYEVSSYTEPSWFCFTQLGGAVFFRDAAHNTYIVGDIPKMPVSTVGGLTRFKSGLYSDYGRPIYKHYQFAVQTLGSLTRQKDVVQVVFALPGDVPASVNLGYLTDLGARDDTTPLAVTPPTEITGINPLGPVIAVRRPDCRHVRSFSMTLKDNTADKGLAIVSAQVLYKYTTPER
jgi:hypothetical protein